MRVLQAIGFHSGGQARHQVHPREVLCVQTLRGVAVLMVLFVHIEDVARKLPEFAGETHTFLSTNVFYSGPDLFFVISGYIMSYITFGMKFQPGPWLVSRVARIYPLYVLFTGFACLVWLTRPEGMVMGSGPHDVVSVLQSFLIVPQAGTPLLFVGWTVEHEIVFYALVFVVAYMFSFQALTAILAGLSVLALARWGVVEATGMGGFWDWHLLSLYVVHFLFGHCVYRFRSLFEGIPAVTLAGAAAALLLTGVLFAHSGAINEENPLRVLTFAGGYALMLAALLNREKAHRAAGTMPVRRPFLARVGDASYSLYLSHPFIVASFGKAFEAAPVSGWLAWAAAATAAVSALAFGMLFYALVERPSLRLFKTGVIKKPQPAPAAGGG